MEKEKEIALYATIPYFGREYSVKFNDHNGYTNCSLTGYGKFPFNEYPGIPVYNMENNWDAVEKFGTIAERAKYDPNIMADMLKTSGIPTLENE